jgi:apolipoprotein N-acyltransferase
LSARFLGLVHDGTFLWLAVASAAFHLAYAWPNAGVIAVAFLFALLQLARLGSARRRYYAGLTVGFLIAIARLKFFWTIFSAGALALWYIYAFWIAVFVALAGFALDRLGARRAWLLVPFLWTGLEWFRSEGYWLRFSWLTPGFAFANAPGQAPLGLVGVYGMGFLLASVACFAVWRWPVSKPQAVASLAAGTAAVVLLGHLAAVQTHSGPVTELRIAGIQMEVPTEPEVLERLNQLVIEHPETELIVLSEYTFMEPVPQAVRNWCRNHQRYLVLGAEDLVSPKQFYNTAFVIGPDGETVFRQVKSVPIQFFKDGLPAPSQQLWNSPWGKIGFCICYDLSYRSVTDRLVRLGAQALIVPTMDVATWGERQHVLHGRVACVRAAEYRIPIFRVASSGMSQHVAAGGEVEGFLPYPGQGQVLRGVLHLRDPGRLPLDTWFAPACALIAALSAALALVPVAARRLRRAK